MSNFHGYYAGRWAQPAGWDVDLDTLDPDELIDEPLEDLADDAPRADRAERIVRRFLRLCEHPRTRRRTLALVRSVVEGGDSGQLLFGLVNTVARPLSVSGTATEKVMRHQVVGFILAGAGDRSVPARARADVLGVAGRGSDLGRTRRARGPPR